MKTTIITKENATIKNIRKAMRGLENHYETLLIEGWGQIKKLGPARYARGPLPELDESDPMRDYTDWTYGWKESWLLKDIQIKLNIA